MTRASASALAAAGILLGSASAASSLPHLSSATSNRRHVVVTFTLGDLVPGQIVVASSPKTEPNGAFVKANVRLHEQLAAKKIATGYRAIGLDCTPHKPCKTDWSNARRVTVR